MNKLIDLGKIDYNGTGRKINKVEIEVKLNDGRLSICGSIWNNPHTDLISGGQNIDEIADLFPNNERVQRIKAVWERYHLNDLEAGSPKQEEYLRNNPVTCKYSESHYEKTCKALKNAGLNPDLSYLHNGKPYYCGTAWLKGEIPTEIIEEVESW
ncbi:hypothetical protein HY212_00090 [Candidatus Pacearchaeota archaeon]|nr:hypothetical protein [Candidatus Pacearchaeota archaeon]